MRVKTSELTGLALDWAVAKALGYDVAVASGTELVIIRRGNVVDYFDPSTNWGWGGPIIEREWICVDRLMNGQWCAAKRTDAGDSMLHMQTGPTPLVAAMRCFVASALGDEVDVPDELVRNPGP